MKRALKSISKNEYNWMLKEAKRKGNGFYSVEERLQRMIEWRIKDRKPLQYILKSQPFMGLDIITRPPVLIPRPETEEWTYYLSQRIKKNIKSDSFKILDLCCGSGCIGLGLLNELKSDIPSFYLEGIDLNPKAVLLSRLNARQHQLSEYSFFKIGNAFEQSMEGFDLIVCNPPYISLSEYQDLEPEVSKWEDFTALVGTYDNINGLNYYQKLSDLFPIRTSSEKLKVKHIKSLMEFDEKNVPQLVMEIGSAHQVEDIINYFQKRMSMAEVWYDFQKIPRVIALS